MLNEDSTSPLLAGLLRDVIAQHPDGVSKMTAIDEAVDVINGRRPAPPSAPANVLVAHFAYNMRLTVTPADIVALQAAHGLTETLEVLTISEALAVLRPDEPMEVPC